jgi:hypothetical protein
MSPPLALSGHSFRVDSADYFFIVVVVIRHETTAAARGALLLIVRTFFNDAITVAVWTGFHVCLPVDDLRKPNPPSQRNAQRRYRQLSDAGRLGDLMPCQTP